MVETIGGTFEILGLTFTLTEPHETLCGSLLAKRWVYHKERKIGVIETRARKIDGGEIKHTASFYADHGGSQACANPTPCIRRAAAEVAFGAIRGSRVFGRGLRETWKLASLSFQEGDAKLLTAVWSDQSPEDPLFELLLAS